MCIRDLSIYMKDHIFQDLSRYMHHAWCMWDGELRLPGDLSVKEPEK